MSMSAEKKFEPMTCDCVVTAKSRPDGSVLISVKQGDRKIRRVIDHTCATQEVIRAIKFELSEKTNEGEIVRVVQNYGPKNLPTFANQPIHRTRYARLWEMRKLKNY
ncbi:hypothetical protein [Pseudomonas yangonensis]|uniref:hypothetical protein n=1 Tax=Pseudomonas yangonensis TaxID=2579922 RepID=UPI001379AB8A|nr:hypothetical protein [Pseudomonas yangonensis]